MHSRTQRQTHWQRWELHWAMLLSTDADRSLVDHKLCRCRGDPSEARLKKKPPANNPEQGKQDVIGCSSGETDATVILEDTKQAGKPAASGGKSRSWILYSLLPDGSRIDQNAFGWLSPCLRNTPAARRSTQSSETINIC